MRNRVRDLAGLEKLLRLTGDERSAVRTLGNGLPIGITPYYASLLDPADPSQPLRRTLVPSLAEFVKSRGEFEDPLGEEKRMPMPGLVHTYPDKVLFLVTDQCAVYCRYCTRARMVGRRGKVSDRVRWQKAIDYIAATPEVRDVLMTPAPTIAAIAVAYTGTGGLIADAYTAIIQMTLILVGAIGLFIWMATTNGINIAENCPPGNVPT